MRVKELFINIDLGELVRKDEEDETGTNYWENCLKFVEQVWEWDIERLTKKQMDWLERISDQLG